MPTPRSQTRIALFDRCRVVFRKAGRSEPLRGYSVDDGALPTNFDESRPERRLQICELYAREAEEVASYGTRHIFATATIQRRKSRVIPAVVTGSRAEGGI